ncbi:ribonuclease Y [Candidatus Peribacteria bacterium]|nr:ribonuclease Y [Candidatus Peribacteria bacterium]
MEYLSYIWPLGGLLVGLGLGYIAFRPKAKLIEQAAIREAERLKNMAEKEVARLQSEAEDHAKKTRKRAEQEEEKILKRMEKKEAESDERLERKEEQLEKRLSKAEESQAKYEQAAEEFTEKKRELQEQINAEMEKLGEIAKLSPEEAKEKLMAQVEAEAESQLAETQRRKVELMRQHADEEASNLLVQSIQRMASTTTAESTLSIVKLANDDLKGRIIGREGRNITAFEQITGVDVIIDDTPGAVTISSFDMYRRYVASMVLEEMLKDGRINPAKIEDHMEKAEKNAEKLLLELGRKAEEELGISGTFPDEVLKLVGRLRFRTSYGQNVLRHSVEVAWLGAEIAQHIPGADPEILKKAGLVHDMGKAVSHEVEGGHALVGRDILQKYGVAKPIWQAMQSHHEDVPYETIESRILQAADAISAARPGARRETLEKYIKRLRQLEEISSNFSGVEKAYALQAGREVRVFVNAREMSDSASEKLSFEVARKIEAECQYPGEVRVHVIRERRFTEVAH